jgi:hypothetical protein
VIFLFYANNLIHPATDSCWWAILFCKTGPSAPDHFPSLLRPVAVILKQAGLKSGVAFQTCQLQCLNQSLITVTKWSSDNIRGIKEV